jgi:hypothetical protein
MDYSIVNRKRAMLGIMFLLVLTLGLLALVLLVPVTNATIGLPSSTPSFVGGEGVPVNIVQLLIPYLLVAVLGVGAILSWVSYRKLRS